MRTLISVDQGALQGPMLVGYASGTQIPSSSTQKLGGCLGEPGLVRELHAPAARRPARQAVEAQALPSLAAASRSPQLDSRDL